MNHPHSQLVVSGTSYILLDLSKLAPTVKFSKLSSWAIWVGQLDEVIRAEGRGQSEKAANPMTSSDESVRVTLNRLFSLKQKNPSFLFQH